MKKILVFGVILGVCLFAAGCSRADRGTTGGTPTNADGADVIWIEGATFTMGASNEDPIAPDDEKPAHQVTVDGFYIYKNEVTNAMYSACVTAGDCEAVSAYEPDMAGYSDNTTFNGYPVMGVTWGMARDYCSWAGARLPTEAEWELAARGTDARTHPWGETPVDCSLARIGGCTSDSFPAAVGSFPQSASPYGVMDMSGNVWEWVNDWYAPDAYSTSGGTNPLGPWTGEYKVLRGGGWLSEAVNTRTTTRSPADPALAFMDAGFRCVASDPDLTAAIYGGGDGAHRREPRADGGGPPGPGSADDHGRRSRSETTECPGCVSDRTGRRWVDWLDVNFGCLGDGQRGIGIRTTNTFNAVYSMTVDGSAVPCIYSRETNLLACGPFSGTPASGSYWDVQISATDASGVPEPWANFNFWADETRFPDGCRTPAEGGPGPRLGSYDAACTSDGQIQFNVLTPFGQTWGDVILDGPAPATLSCSVRTSNQLVCTGPNAPNGEYYDLDLYRLTAGGSQELYWSLQIPKRDCGGGTTSEAPTLYGSAACNPAGGWTAEISWSPATIRPLTVTDDRFRTLACTLVAGRFQCDNPPLGADGSANLWLTYQTRVTLPDGTIEYQERRSSIMMLPPPGCAPAPEEGGIPETPAPTVYATASCNASGGYDLHIDLDPASTPTGGFLNYNLEPMSCTTSAPGSYDCSGAVAIPSRSGSYSGDVILFELLPPAGTEITWGPIGFSIPAPTCWSRTSGNWRLVGVTCTENWLNIVIDLPTGTDWVMQGANDGMNAYGCSYDPVVPDRLICQGQMAGSPGPLQVGLTLRDGRSISNTFSEFPGMASSCSLTPTGSSVGPRFTTGAGCNSTGGVNVTVSWTSPDVAVGRILDSSFNELACTPLWGTQMECANAPVGPDGNIRLYVWPYSAALTPLPMTAITIEAPVACRGTPRAYPLPNYKAVASCGSSGGYDVIIDSAYPIRNVSLDLVTPVTCTGIGSNIATCPVTRLGTDGRIHLIAWFELPGATRDGITDLVWRLEEIILDAPSCGRSVSEGDWGLTVQCGGGPEWIHTIVDMPADCSTAGYSAGIRSISDGSTWAFFCSPGTWTASGGSPVELRSGRECLIPRSASPGPLVVACGNPSVPAHTFSSYPSLVPPASECPGPVSPPSAESGWGLTSWCDPSSPGLIHLQISYPAALRIFPVVENTNPGWACIIDPLVQDTPIHCWFPPEMVPAGPLTWHFTGPAPDYRRIDHTFSEYPGILASCGGAPASTGSWNLVDVICQEGSWRSFIFDYPVELGSSISRVTVTGGGLLGAPSCSHHPTIPNRYYCSYNESGAVDPVTVCLTPSGGSETCHTFPEYPARRSSCSVGERPVVTEPPPALPPDCSSYTTQAACEASPDLACKWKPDTMTCYRP